jgi:hypothetical protein
MHKGSEVIIVVLHVGAMKIYVVVMEAFQKKKKQDLKNSVYHQN